MKRLRFSDEQIIGILKERHAGLSALELCRKYGIGDATFSPGARSMVAWRSRRLKRLEEENAKRKRLLADAMLDASALREMLGKKLLTPGARRKAGIAKWLVQPDPDETGLDVHAPHSAETPLTSWLWAASAIGQIYSPNLIATYQLEGDGAPGDTVQSMLKK